MTSSRYVISRDSRKIGYILAKYCVSLSDCLVDYEDNRILELALASGSFLIILTDKHLLDMSPWRGTLIITPADFVFRVSAMRQAKRSSHLEQALGIRDSQQGR